MNTKIRHTVFGDGMVVNQEADRITVQFSEEYGTKKFVYPNAFDRYLKLSDTNLETVIMGELRSKLSHIKEEKEERQLRYEENLVSEKIQHELEKKKVAKKKKETAKATV
jgi:hypothetical protein